MAERRVMEVQVMAWPAFLDGSLSVRLCSSWRLAPLFSVIEAGFLTNDLAFGKRKVCMLI